MSLNSKEESKNESDLFKSGFNPTYSDSQMLNLFNSERYGLQDLLTQKVTEITKRRAVETPGYTMKEKDIKSLKGSLLVSDYEKAFPKTIKYINERVFHGYDSRFYVGCVNEQSSFYAQEYTKSDFGSTFFQYFPTEIKTYFEMNSLKYTLTMNNEKPRTFIKHNQSFLNLFSGYRFNKNDARDEARIARGADGVEFIWDHIKNVWNSGNIQCFEYDHDWLCKLIGGFKLKTMLYLKGKMGAGKSIVVKFFIEILGIQVSCILNNDRPITGQFNGALMGKSICYLDEIVHDYNDFKSLYNQLKPYITEDHIAYRNLYEKLKLLLNTTSFIMSGNYDMIKLDDPSKGDDRRIKVNDVSEILQNNEYFSKLAKYMADKDVQYAMYHHCLANCKPEWNELNELKKLPVSDTKISMIQQALDSATLFLKSMVNDIRMDTYIKPLDLYQAYKVWSEEADQKKQIINKMTFLNKMKDYKPFVSFVENYRLNGGNPTNYIKIDRKAMIDYFTLKHFWNEYDDINDKKDESKMNYYDNLEDENTKLKNEIEELKKQMAEMAEMKPKKNKKIKTKTKTKTVVIDEDTPNDDEDDDNCSGLEIIIDEIEV